MKYTTDEQHTASLSLHCGPRPKFINHKQKDIEFVELVFDPLRKKILSRMQHSFHTNIGT
jgi:hypothetical protein